MQKQMYYVGLSDRSTVVAMYFKVQFNISLFILDGMFFFLFFGS